MLNFQDSACQILKFDVRSLMSDVRCLISDFSDFLVLFCSIVCLICCLISSPIWGVMYQFFSLTGFVWLQRLYPLSGSIRRQSFGTYFVLNEKSTMLLGCELQKIAYIRTGLTIILRYKICVGYQMVESHHLVSNKREWNSCIIKYAHKVSGILPGLICKKNWFSACF